MCSETNVMSAVFVGMKCLMQCQQERGPELNKEYNLIRIEKTSTLIRMAG